MKLRVLVEKELLKKSFSTSIPKNGESDAHYALSGFPAL